jgi:hypothetical protein
LLGLLLSQLLGLLALSLLALQPPGAVLCSQLAVAACLLLLLALFALPLPVSAACLGLPGLLLLLLLLLLLDPLCIAPVHLLLVLALQLPVGGCHGVAVLQLGGHVAGDGIALLLDGWCVLPHVSLCSASHRKGCMAGWLRSLARLGRWLGSGLNTRASCGRRVFGNSLKSSESSVRLLAHSSCRAAACSCADSKSVEVISPCSALRALASLSGSCPNMRRVVKNFSARSVLKSIAHLRASSLFSSSSPWASLLHHWGS